MLIIRVNPFMTNLFKQVNAGCNRVRGFNQLNPLFNRVKRVQPVFDPKPHFIENPNPLIACCVRVNPSCRNPFCQPSTPLVAARCHCYFSCSGFVLAKIIYIRESIV